MNNNQQNTPTMLSPEERAAFEAFKKEQALKAQQEKEKQDREAYKTLTDEQIERSMHLLKDLSTHIKEVKTKVYDNFEEILALKQALFSTPEKRIAEQNSHTFTNTQGNMRIILGCYQTDSWRDTVDDGIALVHQFITSLAQDQNTKALVQMVLRLLAKDQKGTLKASRILQLRRMAEQTGNQTFLKGVQIIEESYQPQTSKTFIRAEIKNQHGAWVPVSLSITES